MHRKWFDKPGANILDCLIFLLSLWHSNEYSKTCHHCLLFLFGLPHSVARCQVLCYVKHPHSFVRNACKMNKHVSMLSQASKSHWIHSIQGIDFIEHYCAFLPIQAVEVPLVSCNNYMYEPEKWG